MPTTQYLSIEKEIQLIKERNRLVEADKAWETSSFRIVVVLMITYVFAALVLAMIGVTNYLASALLPTVGYFLSTQSLPLLKKWWFKHYYQSR